MTALLRAPDNRVQGFLGPGHVCTVMGTAEYEPIARDYRVPIVITGFEPVDLLEGVLRTVQQLEAGRARGREPVRPGRAAARGIPQSRRLIDDVFEVCDRKWRGVGLIPESGFRLRDEYRDYDAERLFEVADIETQESSVCISGQILKGLKKPHRLPGLRQGMHAADAAGGDDGFVRGRLCRLLRLRPASRGGSRNVGESGCDNRGHEDFYPGRVESGAAIGPPTIFGTCPLPQSQYDRILLGPRQRRPADRRPDPAAVRAGLRQRRARRAGRSGDRQPRRRATA